MATIKRDFPLPASPDVVWRRLSDIGAVNELIDFIGPVTVDGDTRRCEMGDGSKLEELIITVDDASKRVAYSIRQSPFGMEHHSASMQAVSDGNGGTRFVWVSDFTPDAVASALEGAIDQSVESIQRVFA